MPGSQSPNLSPHSFIPEPLNPWVILASLRRFPKHSVILHLMIITTISGIYWVFDYCLTSNSCTTIQSVSLKTVIDCLLSKSQALPISFLWKIFSAFSRGWILSKFPPTEPRPRNTYIAPSFSSWHPALHTYYSILAPSIANYLFGVFFLDRTVKDRALSQLSSDHCLRKQVQPTLQCIKT